VGTTQKSDRGWRLSAVEIRTERVRDTTESGRSTDCAAAINEYAT